MKTTEDLALQAIGIVDYDIMKECQEQIEDEEDPDMVDEMSRFLNKTVNESVKKATTELQARVRELEKQLDAAGNRIKQYEAAYYLLAHEVIFCSVEASPFFVPCDWIIEEGKILNWFANVNDTFFYAAADAEPMALDDVLDVYNDAVARFPEKPWVAVAIWAQKKRGGMEFITPVKEAVCEAITAYDAARGK